HEADDHSRSVTPPPDPWYNDSWGFDLEPRLYMLGAMGQRLRVSDDIDAGAEFSAYATRPASSHKVRSNFDPLAYFAGDLVTDAKGRATATIKLPDNLTRYRILAVAAGQRQFGTGQSNLTARLALMVRPSAPRFLNLGDSCQLPVVLHNQTERELETEVALRAANAHLGQAGFRVKVPANDRVEVLFEVKPDLPGQARFAVAARSGAKGDAARFELPVWTPAATQDLAVYGSLDDQLVGLPIRPPPDAYPGFGGLQVTTSSTAVASLDDALRYLEEYPFECSEQVASRLLGRVTMGARPEKIQADLDRLLQAQHYEGGWGFWAGQTDSDPFVSVHAFHALVRAKAAGWAIPERNWQQGLGQLADLGKACPPGYSQPAWFCLRAYGLYVRQLAGRSVSAASLVKEAGGLEQLPTEALGWLLPVLVGEQRQAARQVLLNRMDETASGVSFEQTLGSPERTQAVVLEAMLGDQPESELIPKLVRGLEDQRRDGRWRTTQENAWAVLALSRYFHTYEKQSPDFVSKVWLGNSYLGQHAFRGRTKAQRQTSVPLAELQAGNLVLAKQGKGRLYYRVGLRYAPTDLNPPAQDRGFAVQRSYEAVDDNRDVARRADGSWRIRAGARVRVKLTMAVDGRRSQVALVDHLPAGLEAFNPSLAVSATAIPSESVPGWWWSGSWYEHQNLRDERVEAFSSTVWPGVYEYRYDALASTPGQFVAPAARAEEMYHPETFGRSASDRVTVEL
ncbi:MAG: hypothetical protein KC910_27735, partial [Candidatus Eremiobacteraeota bacterium]|nr:hypothetical protein [Candidatus Eremiobacteraeota bacterium]